MFAAGSWQADISGGLGLDEELMMRIFEAVRLEEQDGIVKLGWFLDTTRSECACGILIHLPSYVLFWAFSRHGQL